MIEFGRIEGKKKKEEEKNEKKKTKGWNKISTKTYDPFQTLENVRSFIRGRISSPLISPPFGTLPKITLFHKHRSYPRDSTSFRRGS